MVMITKPAFSQIPTEYALYGQLSLQPGLYSLSGINPAEEEKESTFGCLMSWKYAMYADDGYAEVTTDIPLSGLISIIQGDVEKPHPTYSIINNNVDETKFSARKPGREYDLAFARGNILGISASSKIYESFTLGFHLGWDIINSSVIEKDNREIAGLDGALNLNYWNFAPVIGYQDEYIRVEAKYLWNRAKTIDKGREIRLTGDYFLSNNSESLAITVGAFVNHLSITTSDERPLIDEVKMFAVGLRVSFIYPSIWNLIAN